MVSKFKFEVHGPTKKKLALYVPRFISDGPPKLEVLGGSSVLMGLLTGVLASAFLVRIGATLCLGDNMAQNEVLHNGVCRVVLDAAMDFIENIDKNDNAGKKSLHT